MVTLTPSVARMWSLFIQLTSGLAIKWIGSLRFEDFQSIWTNPKGFSDYYFLMVFPHRGHLPFSDTNSLRISKCSKRYWSESSTSKKINVKRVILQILGRSLLGVMRARILVM